MIDIKENLFEVFLVIPVFYMLSSILQSLIRKLLNFLETPSEYKKYLVKELEKEGKIKDYNEEDEDDEDVCYARSELNKRDIIALMLKNNDEITEYFTISKNQAKSSFWFSVVSCIIGLVALVISIYGIVVLKDVSVSIISLISGVISELISGTVFWVHNKSALQLNHYYSALHENEKFLSAVNIADKLSPEKREEVLVEIIKNQIKIENTKTEIEK